MGVLLTLWVMKWHNMEDIFSYPLANSTVDAIDTMDTIGAMADTSVKAWAMSVCQYGKMSKTLVS